MENSYHVGVQEDAFILFLGNGKDSSRMSEVEQNATAMEIIAATYTIMLTCGIFHRYYI